MENSRVLAVIDESLNGNSEGIIKSLQICNAFSKCVVFSREPSRFSSLVNTEVVQIPESADSRPKRKNFAIRYFKEKKQYKYLHLLEDKIEIVSDNYHTIGFICEVENLMKAFDISNFMGTATDGCNFVYTKYNPRLNVVLDDQKYQQFGFGQNVLFCSHSNVQWIVIDLENSDENEMYFDESFIIDMYWIIEFLARRRNSHADSMYFMNQYLTCASEYGVYKFKEGVRSNEPELPKDQMGKEDTIFKSKCLSYSPDNNIDLVLERMYQKLQSKIESKIV